MIFTPKNLKYHKQYSFLAKNILQLLSKIIDRVTGSPVSGPDLQGEICIKTCQMSPGYLDIKEDLLDSEGYFHTGDMGYYDKDGIIHFVEQVGRINPTGF